MPERPDVDELTLLRAADPIDGGSLPAPSHPAARVLFETITTSPEATSTTRDRKPAPRPLVLAAAGLIALGLIGAGAVTLLRDTTDNRDTEIAASQPTPGTTTGPITPGGSIGSCVEVYDLQTLANRELAFDGTVKELDGDTATFTVNQWYRGGDTGEITLAGAAGLSGLTSGGPAATLEPGTRLLVAGDGGFAWACGFTQPYNASVARQWQQTFNR